METLICCFFLSMISSTIYWSFSYFLASPNLLECKLVSKSWRNLVYHPCFSGMHLPHLKDPGKLTFLCTEYEQLSYLEYHENHHEHNIRRINTKYLCGKSYTIIGSCNGLVCLNDCHDNRLCDYQPAYVCNPITKEYGILPKYDRYRDPIIYVIYDGFGYIRETNEYKVVRIDQLRDKPNLERVEVYTLGSGSGWRNAGYCGLSSPMDSYTKIHGVFVSDSIYWITSTGKIVCFNLADEKFCEIPTLPCLSTGEQWGFELGILGEVLCCSNISYYLDNGGSYARKTTTWLLKKIGSQNRIEQEEYLSLNWEDNSARMKPLSLMKSGEVLCYNNSSSQTSFHSYDIKSCCAKTLMSFPQYFEPIIPHMNTLISLKALGEEDTKTMD